MRCSWLKTGAIPARERGFPRGLRHVAEKTRVAAPARTSQAVPAVTRGFIGRQRERDWLRTELTDGGLVTVVGPPGVGKSRLAFEVARTTALAVVELTDVVGVDGVQRAVTLALGWRAHGPTSRVAKALREQARPLLVLDDADRARDTLGPLMHTWLSEVPGLRLLCTARQPMDQPGEKVLWLEGLDCDAARALYLERARRIAPARLVDAATVDPELEVLLRRLDGLPLAIELAAARADLRSPGELLREMDDRFAALAPRTRDVLPSLWDTLERSWRSLDDELRQGLCALAVVEPPTPRSGAQALMGRIRGLDALVERSLVSVTSHAGERAYGLLDSVRDFARARSAEDGLDSVAIAAARRRYVQWVRREASERQRVAARHPSAHWSSLLALEPHLIAALSFVAPASDDATALVLARDAIMVRTGPAHSHEAMLSEQLARVDPTTAQAAELMTALGRVHQLANRYHRSRALLLQALACFEALGRTADIVRLRYYVARAYVQIMDDPVATREVIAQAMSTAREADMPVYAAGAISTLGMVEHFEGDLDAAVRRHEEATAALPEEHATRIGPVLHVHHALARLDRGEVALASALLDLCRGLMEERRDELLIAKLEPTLAHIAGARGDMAQARLHLSRGEAAAERLDDLGLRVHLELERARLEATIEPASARAALARARASAVGMMTPRLERDFRRVEARIDGTPAPGARRLRIARDGDGFRRGAEDVVDLRRRGAVRRILAALAKEVPLSVDAIVQAGWPDERILPESAAKRVWTAVWTLRRAGLQELLRHDERGYVLACDRLVVVPFEEL